MFSLNQSLVVRVVVVIVVVCSCCFCLNVLGNGIAELSKEHIRFKVRTCSEDLPAVKVKACVPIPPYAVSLGWRCDLTH